MPPDATSKSSRGPRLIILSAPSGAGKTTLCNMLLREYPSRIAYSISTTTRSQRPSERNGIDYHFVTPEVFEQKRLNGDFAEFAQVHNNWYGTSKSDVEQFLTQGKHVIFDIDVHGAMNLKKQYGTRCLLIFIRPPSMEDLKTRLVQRQGDSRTSIETRLQNAYNELEWSKKFDYQIVNDHLERAFQELKEIVKKECR